MCIIKINVSITIQPTENNQLDAPDSPEPIQLTQEQEQIARRVISLWDDNEGAGEQLQALREKLGLDRSSFATLLQVSKETVYRWERREENGKPPGPANKEKFKDIFSL